MGQALESEDWRWCWYRCYLLVLWKDKTLIHSTPWCSSVRAKHLPWPILNLPNWSFFKGASLCSCQVNKFTENPGRLKTAESVTCSVSALPLSATNLAQLESIKAQHPTSPPVHLSHTSPTKRGWALMPSEPLAYLAKAKQVRDAGL